MTSPIHTLRSVFAQLEEESLIASVDEAEVRHSFNRPSIQDMSPWYVRGLVGISAWFATILFLIFLFGTKFIGTAPEMIATGAICLCLVTAMRRRVSTLFFTQLLLAFSLAGQFLLIGGIAWRSDEPLSALIAAIILELLLIVLYVDAVHRFFPRSSGLARSLRCCMNWTCLTAFIC